MGTVKANWASGLRSAVVAQVMKVPTSQGTRSIPLKPGGKPK